MRQEYCLLLLSNNFMGKHCLQHFQVVRALLAEQPQITLFMPLCGGSSELSQRGRLSVILIYCRTERLSENYTGIIQVIHITAGIL